MSFDDIQSPVVRDAFMRLSEYLDVSKGSALEKAFDIVLDALVEWPAQIDDLSAQVEMWKRCARGLEPRPSASVESGTYQERTARQVITAMGGCGAIEAGMICIQTKGHKNPCFESCATDNLGAPRPSEPLADGTRVCGVSGPEMGTIISAPTVVVRWDGDPPGHTTDECACNLIPIKARTNEAVPEPINDARWQDLYDFGRSLLYTLQALKWSNAPIGQWVLDHRTELQHAMKCLESPRSNEARCDAIAWSKAADTHVPEDGLLAAWKGVAEDGSIGFDCQHEGRARALVTLRSDGGVEVVVNPRLDKAPLEEKGTTNG